MANVVAITKLFTKNLVPYKYLSLHLHSIVVFGGRLEEFLKYRQALQFYACKHAVISAKRRPAMWYFAFLEGFSRKNSSSRLQESCFEVEVGFSY